MSDEPCDPSDAFRVWAETGALNQDKAFAVGPSASYQLRHTPRRVLFCLSRYKFAAKMIGDGRSILELGCGDGFFNVILNEFASSYTGVDFDEDRLAFARATAGQVKNGNVEYLQADFLGASFGTYDAVVTFDVIEHILPETETRFVDTIRANLAPTGMAIVGTPNIRTREFSSESVNQAHINMYDGDRLRALLERAFHQVFMFSQNDEMVHTGFTPMANYLLAVCCHPK